MSGLVVLVAAGGRGERCGGQEPKQFWPVAGKPVLFWALERLLGLGPRRITVALPAGRRLPLEEWGLAGREIVAVSGGLTRQQSIAAALAATPGPGDELVAIHDGARAATAPADLAAVVAAAGASGAAVLGRPVSDTVKRVTAGRIVATVDRRGLFRAETPQVFRRALLKDALARAEVDGVEETDESALVERLGGVVIAAVEAGAPNPKLTVPSDLAVLAALLGAG